MINFNVHMDGQDTEPKSVWSMLMNCKITSEHKPLVDQKIKALLYRYILKMNRILFIHISIQ